MERVVDTRGLSGAEAFLRLLAGMGVERIFASPGSEWSPVWEHLAKASGSGAAVPAYCSSRHEETAVAMASGYTKATGRLAAVMLHTTVGALHAAMALRAAVHEQVPMAVFAGESMGFGDVPGPDPGPQWLRVLSDVGGPARLIERCVKWSVGLGAAATLPATIQRACQLALANPAGPTFVSIPMEFLFETMTTTAPDPAAVAHPAAASPAALDDLARALTRARQPVIVAEEVGRSVRAVEHLVAIAELLGAPVVDSWFPAFLNFPRTHPLYGGVGPADVSAHLREADLVFVVGGVAPWHPASSAPGAATRVAVLAETPFRPDLPAWSFRCDVAVAGHVETSLGLLLARLRDSIAPGSRGDSAARWAERHAERRRVERQEAEAAATHTPLLTPWVAHQLNEALPADAIVVDETITHRLDLHRFLDRLAPGGFFAGSHGGLGTGLATALGVKVAAPDRPVVVVIGDGSFNYNPVLATFGAAQEHGLPILVVLFDNAGYLSQRSDVSKYYPGGWAVRAGQFAGTAITPGPDYPAIARAFGGHGETVVNPAEVRAALHRGLEATRAGRLALLDMKLPPISAAPA